MGNQVAKVTQAIPGEDLWAMATRALTAGITGIGNAVVQAGGPQLHEAVTKAVWSEGGHAAADIARSLHLPTGTVRESVEAMLTVAIVLMGPGFEVDVKAAGPDVVRTTAKKCPWRNRQLEMNISGDLCGDGCLAWHAAFLRSLDPTLNIRRTKAMPLGDSTCVFETRR